ncbi:hypothetical protein [Methylomagnum ishizawai]|uniref:hypothetical protein n=1 Tax=Methylomagnum ishizawai TaxID=1760988 RepID=UPI001C32F303|nr:hypothetical protein [Methylomagnum ishizawai]BBL74748.1 hypothetical protein MishRS11D_18460 [Methylomagnum ishizawai]
MHHAIPDPDSARQTLKPFFPAQHFPRLGAHIKQRLAPQFHNWNQGQPEIMAVRRDSAHLRPCLNHAGRHLPLAVVGQIAYGPGAGHSYFGIHRHGKFPGEESHTYLYHATPGRVLKNGQAADYFRLDHVRGKPSLYAFWLLSWPISHQAADEIHRRWQEQRYRVRNEYDFDCASFVTDIAKHVASLGPDPNMPFTLGTPSNTIKRGHPEDRGMRAILHHAHRPPAALLFILDPGTYESVAWNGHIGDDGGWVIDADSPVFNVTSQ